MAKKGKLVCVVPVYNESDIIVSTINGLKTIEYIDKIVIINDGSTDNTLNVINTLGVKVINLKKNHGKGYAMKVAMNSLKYDYIGFIDGDLGHTSKELEKLIIPIRKGEADVFIAQFPRAKTVTNKKGGFGLVMLLARKGVQFFTGDKIENSLSGQRIYKKDVINKIKYVPNRYGIEVAMTIQALNNGFIIKSIPVAMKHRYTERDLKGIIHRGKQFWDILITLIIMYFKGLKR